MYHCIEILETAIDMERDAIQCQLIHEENNLYICFIASYKLQIVIKTIKDY